ncbi:AAA family ATPase [Burkholderia ubonensis]|uniref:AAA family ATPase n=1 Tax=Burkholderia ubonensis TaxID=101571 RepID=UPI0009B323A8|nr:AAA family ATPase [Burkholderia ubonensis]
MRLTALICNRYRAFKERQRIELAPITLIIGKNGSGKSVISRLPLLLANAISEQAEGPLDLAAGGVEHAAAFQDLVNSRGALPFTLGAEIADEHRSYSFETTLRYVNETRSLAIESFLLKAGTDTLFSAEISDVEELTKDSPVFDTQFEAKEKQKTRLSFAGLFPRLDGLGDPASGEIAAVLASFRQALPTPSYLGPFRAEPSPSMRTPNQNIRELGPRGERALDILADDRLRRGGELSRKVSEWFGTAMGQQIEVDITGDQPQVRVADEASGLQVSLADTGAGFSQSIPVVVQHFAYRAGRIKSPVLIVEQPELHLHPAAHGALADLVVQSATGTDWTPATCLVETHSEQFIMRVRRRIAEGVPPEQVKLWSLNHHDEQGDETPPQPLRVISFDSRGNPDAWPIGVFEEALSDLTAMRRGARGRGL